MDVSGEQPWAWFPGACQTNGYVVRCSRFKIAAMTNAVKINIHDFISPKRRPPSSSRTSFVESAVPSAIDYRYPCASHASL